MFKCNVCDCAYNRKDSLKRHAKTHELVRYSCNVCTKDFSRKDSLFKHVKKEHKGNNVPNFCVPDDQAVISNQGIYYNFLI